jgi:Cys-tRNA synthase (O-phospho-L-seryl-tRNA:Cys-tRNA synthase)
MDILTCSHKFQHGFCQYCGKGKAEVEEQQNLANFKEEWDDFVSSDDERFMSERTNEDVD